jgi:hypothetical protein
VWWDNPIDRSGESRFHVHVLNWLEIQGDDHERQYPQIMHFLGNFNLSSVVVDATGRGDPIYDRLNADLREDDVEVWPFIFTTRSKHEGYTLLYQELFEGRLTYPASDGAQKSAKWRRFIKQTTNLEKHWRGKYMNIEAPKAKGSKILDKPHDDYADSLMMVCWLIHRKAWGIDYGDSITREADIIYDRHHRGRRGFTRNGRRTAW